MDGPCSEGLKTPASIITEKIVWCMSYADLTASAILKDWVLRLRRGNEITHGGWAEIMLAKSQLSLEEKAVNASVDQRPTE